MLWNGPQTEEGLRFVWIKVRVLLPFCNCVSHDLFQSDSCPLPLPHRASWVNTASCLSEPSVCCLRSTSDCSCQRPKANLCQSSQVNSTNSTIKARTNSVRHTLRLSTSWVKCVTPQPCRRFLLKHMLTCVSLGPDHLELVMCSLTVMGECSLFY